MKIQNFTLAILACALLAGCNSEPNTSESISLPSISDGKISEWNEKLQYDMIVAVGETIPFIDDFQIQKYVFNSDGSGTPYINPYIENAKADLTEKYASSVLEFNYKFTFDSQEEDVLWHYYRKYNGDDYIELKFSYYMNEGINYFEIYAYLNIPGGGLPIPTSCSYKLETKDFSNSYVDKTFKFGESELNSKSILANADSRIQFKKGEGIIYNDVQILPLKYIYIENPNNEQYIEIRAGKTKDELFLLPTFNNVYYLNSYTYISIKCPANAKSFTCSSIWFINNN